MFLAVFARGEPGTITRQHSSSGYRELLVHADVTSPGTGNVAPDVQGVLLHQGQHQGTQRQTQRDDWNAPEGNADQATLDSARFLFEHDYMNVLTDIDDEVLRYIGGCL